MPRHCAERTRRLRRAGLVATAVIAASCGSHGGAAPAPADPLRQGPQGNVAQFVVECELSHVAFDDPIVHPGMAGDSHLHLFFGNVEVGAEPDAAIRSADTSCERSGDTASYWAPALLDAAGSMIEPMRLTAYYRPGPGIDPASVEPYPAGLMMVAGDAMATEEQPLDVIAWGCSTGARRHPRPPDCRVDLGDGAIETTDTTLRVWLTFPDCWDGRQLTTGTTGGHVAESVDGACPETHPVPIPELQMAIDFPAVDPAGLSLASGDIGTAHGDFWNLWDQEVLENEVRVCLNRDLVCGVSS